MSSLRRIQRDLSLVTSSRHSLIFGYDRYDSNAVFRNCVALNAEDFSSHHFHSSRVQRKSESLTRHLACSRSAFSFSSRGRFTGLSQLIAATTGRTFGSVPSLDASISILARRGSNGIFASARPVFVRRVSSPRPSRAMAPSSISSRSPSRMEVAFGGSMKGNASIEPRRNSSIVKITPASEERSISGGVYSSLELKDSSE